MATNPRYRRLAGMRPHRRRWEALAVDVTGRGVAVWATAPDEDRARAVLEQLAGGPVVVMREQVYW